MIIAVYIVLLFLGIVFISSYFKLVRDLRLLFIRPIWESYPGTILESNGEMIMEEVPNMPVAPVRKFSTSIKVAYQVNEQTFETYFNERAFMNKSLSETKTAFKIHFPVGKIIPVYINGKDRSEIEIDESKKKRNKIGLEFNILFNLIRISMGIALIGVGIFGIYSQLK